MNKLSEYFLIFFESVAIFMSIFFFLQYIIVKRKEQLYYSIYLFLISMYYLLAMPEFFFNITSASHTELVYFDMFKRPVQFFISVFYTLFVIYFLGLKERSRPLYRLFYYLLILYIVLAVGCFICNYFRIDYDKIYYVVGMLLFPVQLYLVLALFKYKVPYSRYIIWGSINVLVGSIITLMFSLYLAEHPTGPFTNVNSYYPVIIAIMADILLFTVAIQHKIADNEKSLVNAIFNRQKAIMQERERIITDLHDDVGGGLSSIRMMSDLMSRPQTPGNTLINFSEKISATAKEIAQRMNTIIWSLNTENDTLHNFVEYVRQYGLDYFEDSPISFKCCTEHGLPANLVLSGVQRKNLFLIIKEAFHNILKHSEAGEAATEIKVENDKLILTVSDNGRGIKQSNTFGNGLKNMKKRMEEINGFINFIDGDGTTIIVNLSLG